MTTRWFETEIAEPRGVVLVGHGLNNKAEVMDSLISVLVEAGYHCLRFGLHENAVPRPRVPDDVGRRWMATVAEAYDEMAARFPGLPRHNLSYSLGALVSVRLLATRRSSSFESMVLIAPPLALTWTASLVRLLKPLARFGLSLPSAAPKDVRIRRGTPLAEYAAMLDMHDGVRSVESQVFDRIPTLVVLDRKDELVRYRGVFEWIERNGLARWSAKEAAHRAPERRTYRHLLVVESALGERGWRSLTGDILSWFTGDRARG